MKKLIFFLLTLSCFISLNTFAVNTNSKDVAVIANITNTNNNAYLSNVSQPNKVAIHANNAENIVFNLVDTVRHTQPNIVFGGFTNLQYQVTFFSLACGVILKTQNQVFVPFKKTDIIFPFHNHF